MSEWSHGLYPSRCKTRPNRYRAVEPGAQVLGAQRPRLLTQITEHWSPGRRGRLRPSTMPGFSILVSGNFDGLQERMECVSRRAEASRRSAPVISPVVSDFVSILKRFYYVGPARESLNFRVRITAPHRLRVSSTSSSLPTRWYTEPKGNTPADTYHPVRSPGLDVEWLIHNAPVRYRATQGQVRFGRWIGLQCPFEMG